MADWKKLLDDAVSQIGEVAQTAGEGLRTAASEAGKVVGIGVGTIEVRPRLSGFHRLGEDLTGTVTLELAEPIQARRLTVSLRALRKRLVVDPRVQGGSGRRTFEDEVVHEFSEELAGSGTFESGERSFRIETPDELEPEPEIGGLLGDAMKAARAVKSMTEGRLRWQLVATLEIPWKRNLSTSVDVTVREEPGAAGASSASSTSWDAEPPSEEDRWAELERKAKEAEIEAEVQRRRAAQARTRAEREQQATARAEREAEAKRKADAEREAEAKRKAEAEREAEAERQAAAQAPPEPIALPGGWMTALSQTLCDLQARGWVVIHHHCAPPVSPQGVREVLQRHPDLDPEILMFYGVMDGLELMVARPSSPAGGQRLTDAAREVAAKHDGWIGCLGEIWSDRRLGPLLEAELEGEDDRLRTLEIAPLDHLFDDSEDFPARDGRIVIHGCAWLYYGDYLGLTRSEEIRRWRAGGSEPYDYAAKSYQARLRQREAERQGSWWVVHGEDHGGLREPPVVLRWSEMLGLCLRHLRGE